jgi:hypothetical protein
MKALPLLLLAPLLAAGQPAPPRFSFAVLTDIQYGDQPPTGKREYRKSLGKDSTLILSTDSDLFRFLKQISPTNAPSGK